MRGWDAIEAELPEDFEALAKGHKVLEVQYGGAKIRTARDLLRLILLHAGADLPLRQTVATTAESEDGPDVGHVTLHEKMRLAAPYLRALVSRLAGGNEAIPGRLIATRLPAAQAEKARAWVRREIAARLAALDALGDHRDADDRSRPVRSKTSAHAARARVPPVDRRADERVDFRDDFGCEGLFEPPFFATPPEAASGASTSVSAHRSQASQTASTRFRNCWPASTCRRTAFACPAPSQRDLVLPFTTRETLKYGPYRASGSPAHGQPGLLHFTRRSVTEPRRIGRGSASCAARSRTSLGGVERSGVGADLRIL